MICSICHLLLKTRTKNKSNLEFSGTVVQEVDGETGLLVGPLAGLRGCDGPEWVEDAEWGEEGRSSAERGWGSLLWLDFGTELEGTGWGLVSTVVFVSSVGLVSKDGLGLSTGLVSGVSLGLRVGLVSKAGLGLRLVLWSLLFGGWLAENAANVGVWSRGRSGASKFGLDWDEGLK